MVFSRSIHFMEFKERDKSERGHNSLYGGQEDNSGQSWDTFPGGAHEQLWATGQTHSRLASLSALFLPKLLIGRTLTHRASLRLLGPEMVKN